VTEFPDGALGDLPSEPVADLPALMAALAAAPADRAAFGVVRPEGLALVTVDPPADASPAQRLDVAVLESRVLVPGLGADQAALTARGVLGYTKDPEDAAAQVVSGRAAAAFLLRPIPKAAVAAVSEAGETMPQKSTYFFPKLLTGVAFHTLVDG
jgi:uncharacterized protein (DUF1015 family)